MRWYLFLSSATISSTDALASTADALAALAALAFAHLVLKNGSSWTQFHENPSHVCIINDVLLILRILGKMRKIIPLNYRTFFRGKFVWVENNRILIVIKIAIV